jgi:hypothetical protein
MGALVPTHQKTKRPTPQQSSTLVGEQQSLQTSTKVLPWKARGYCQG